MLGNKKLKEQMKRVEVFEECFCKIVENYFTTNEQPSLKYSTEGATALLYKFVLSVDNRIKKLEQTLEEASSIILEKDSIIRSQEKFIEELKNGKEKKHSKRRC
jgi:predicted transcriptional regulator